MVKEVWKLVTCSNAKIEALSHVVRLAGIDTEVNHLACAYNVHEKHGVLHASSKHLFADKFCQSWNSSRGSLGDNLGIANDVCPKVKGAHEHNYLNTLYKYHRKKGKPIERMGLEGKLSALTWYISLIFSQYRDLDAIDLRQSSGVGVFRQTMIGMLIQKMYTHFPTNPLPSKSAIKECLEYARTSHRSIVTGELDNLELEISAGAAGGILPISLIEWYLQSHPKASVTVDGLSNAGEISEIEMLGRGFTPKMVQEIKSMSEASHKGATTVASLAQLCIPITKSRHDHLVWSNGDGKVVVQ